MGPGSGQVQRFPVGRSIGNNDWFWLHDLFMFLIAVAFIVGLVLLVRLIVRRPHWTHGPGAHPALAELDLRYARGEVNRDEYLQRRTDLLNSVAPVPPLAPPMAPPPAPKPDKKA